MINMTQKWRTVYCRYTLGDIREDYGDRILIVEAEEQKGDGKY